MAAITSSRGYKYRVEQDEELRYMYHKKAVLHTMPRHYSEIPFCPIKLFLLGFKLLSGIIAQPQRLFTSTTSLM